MRTLLSICAVICLATSLRAEPNRLNLYIWSDYIDPKVVSDFEREFKCKVNIDLYEDAESMLAKVQGGGASLYDVVVPPDHIVPAMIKLRLLAPLRHENLPNLNNLEAQFVNPPYDPGNHYTAAYQWGTLGIFVRQAAGTPAPETWGLFFDPALQPGPIVLIDSVRDLLGAALKFKGYSINSTNVNELKEARDLVLDAKKRSLGFEGSVGAKNRVLAKAATAAMAYSGEGVRGMEDDPKTVYFIPKEGSQIWVDNMAVLAKAPHRDLAEKFLNFILEGRISARISTFTQFSCPNRAARQFIQPKDLKNPVIYPPLEILQKLEFLRDLGSQTRLYDEIWTQIKAK
jgi:spermidine/putrescine transport system substrate-binding protein